jgi:hypothetical protein
VSFSIEERVRHSSSKRSPYQSESMTLVLRRLRLLPSPQQLRTHRRPASGGLSIRGGASPRIRGEKAGRIAITPVRIPDGIRQVLHR